MKYLSSFDLYPDNLGFYFKDKKAYRNSFGGLMSIISLLTFLILSIFTITDFVNSNSTPSVFNQILKKDELIDFNDDEFYINLSFEFRLNKVKINPKESDIEFYNKNLDNEVTLEKINDNTSLKYKIKFSAVNYVRDQKEIWFYFKSNIKLGEKDVIILNIEYADLMINNTDYENPLSYSNDIRTFYAYGNIAKDVYIELIKTYIETSSGLIYTNTQSSNKTYIQDCYGIDFPKQDDKSGEFFINISSSLTHMLYSRTYRKFIELIPNINSNYSIISTCFHILCFYFKKRSIDIVLLNEIFNFYDEQPDLKSNNSLNSKKKNLRNINKINEQSVSTIRNISNKKMFNLRNKEILNKKENYFDCKDLLSHYTLNTCFRMAYLKKNNFMTGLDIKNKFLNIQNYLFKLMEFEFLKNVILDEDQLKLFKLLKIPCIFESKDSDDFSYIIQNFQSFSLKKDINLRDNGLILESQRTISTINRKNEISRIDLKLLNNIRKF